jgi:uncharacterized protein
MINIIDSHVHIGLNEFCMNSNTKFKFDLTNKYTDFINIINETNIDKTIILPIPHKDFDSYLSNDYLISAYNAFPEKFIPFCRIDDRLEENFKRGFRGIKIHLLYEEIEILKIKNALLFLESIDVPLIIHALFNNKPKQIKEILKITPNLKIILAHMGRGNIYTDEGVIENALALKGFDNIYFETSTVGKQSAVKKVCNIIGEDRVVFGSDYPFGKAWYKSKKQYFYCDEIAFLNNIDLPVSILEKIFYSNIYNFLNLNQEIETIIIRKIKKDDFKQVVEILSNLNTTDKKFLALEHKLSFIKQNIKNEIHCYIASLNGKIVGFMRESGRPEKYSLLEELVVLPEYRQHGIAKKMIKHYHRIFSKTLAKTNSKNDAIIKLLKSTGYQADNPDAKRIINWIRCEE